MFWCTENVKFHFRWGAKPGNKKQEIGSNCDVISGLQAFRKTDFSVIFFLWAIKSIHQWYKSALFIRKCQINLFFAKLAVLKWCHIHSQSPVFCLAVLYPIGSKMSCFDTSKHGEWKSLSKIFFAMLISTLGRFNRANKKISKVYSVVFWINCFKLSSSI